MNVSAQRGTPGAGLVARFRKLPVVSWIWPENHSAEAGAGCGMVGGACCAGGAVVKGLGLASAASISSFVGAATPYFIAASVLMMAVWAFWLLRQTGYQPKPFARSLVRNGVTMGAIYGITLGATMMIASATGIRM